MVHNATQLTPHHLHRTQQTLAVILAVTAATLPLVQGFGQNADDVGDAHESDEFLRWDGMGWDEMGWDGMGCDGVGWDCVKEINTGERKVSERGPRLFLSRCIFNKYMIFLQTN